MKLNELNYLFRKSVKIINTCPYKSGQIYKEQLEIFFLKNSKNFNNNNNYEQNFKNSKNWKKFKNWNE